MSYRRLTNIWWKHFHPAWRSGICDYCCCYNALMADADMKGWDSLASLACSPDGPGLEVSVLEDPGKDSLGFGRLTLGLKRAAHSNFDELVVLACSLSRVLRRGEGLDAERERRALLWSFPCLTRAPCVAVLLVPVMEEEEEDEAEEEESVTLLHPALAEAADLDASLVGFAVLPSLQLAREAAVLLRPGRVSDFFLFWLGEPPATTLFLLWPRPDDAEESEATGLFLDLAGPFLVSEVLSRGWWMGLDFLEGVGPRTLIWSGASLRLSPRVPSLFEKWPDRSCSDVPAVSGSSCKTNEATDRVRPLLFRRKKTEKNRTAS